MGAADEVLPVTKENSLEISGTEATLFQLWLLQALGSESADERSLLVWL